MYWLLLVYTVFAIGWWYIELNNHNATIYKIEKNDLDAKDTNYELELNRIENENNRNRQQFLAEAIVFLLVIIAGAIFIFRRIIKELKNAKEQQSFLMAITHELKTPIAVSRLNLETMQKHKLSGDQQEKLIGNTLTETNRLATLCNNLLVSYQMEGSKYNYTKQELNLSELLHEVINSFQIHFPNRAVIFDITEGLFIIGDPFLLEIAINNLLENAAKYSPKEKPILITLHENKNDAIIKVIDEGDGIFDDEKTLVFNKFYRTGNAATKAAKGTGLGLYLANKICETHDGKITIENNPVGGTIFIFALQTIE